MPLWAVVSHESCAYYSLLNILISRNKPFTPKRDQMGRKRLIPLMHSGLAVSGSLAGQKSDTYYCLSIPAGLIHFVLHIFLRSVNLYFIKTSHLVILLDFVINRLQRALSPDICIPHSKPFITISFYVYNSTHQEKS